MAFRKRTTIKRRSRVTKRSFKRKIRKTVRRKSRRVLSTPVIHQTETIDTADINLNTIALNVITGCQLQDFPRLLQLAKFYNEFKINKFTVTHTPKQHPQFWTGPLGYLQSLTEPLKAITYSDKQNDIAAGTASGGVASYNAAMNMPSARMHSLQRPIRRTVRGTVMQDLTIATNQFSIKSPWLRTYSDSGLVQLAYPAFQGIGTYFPALALPAPSGSAVVPAFTTVKTISVSFRGKRVPT